MAEEQSPPLTKKQKRNRLHYETYKESRKRKKSRYQFKIEVPKEDEGRLVEIRGKMDKIKGQLKLESSRTANADLIDALLDNWLNNPENINPSTTPEQLTQDSHSITSTPAYDQFLQNIEDSSSSSTPFIAPQSLLIPKTQIHSLCEENDEIYLVCGSALERLFKFFLERGNSCSCGEKYALSTLEIVRATKHSHCVKVVVACTDKHIVEWFSSSMMSSPSAGKYFVNVRMVHAFTSAGLLASQYESFCQAARLGHMNEHYVSDVYQKMKYIEAVEGMASYECSGAIAEIKSTDKYKQDGEGIMIDARYDSVRTAYHTSVTAISMMSHKIIGIKHCSRTEIASLSSREKPISLALVDILQEELNITEVSHDTVLCLKNALIARGITNSFDTWHGGKNVKKSISTIAKGTLKNEGKIWFCELSDKVKSVKTHFYYAMKNCDRDPKKLQKSLLNVVEHYKGNHEDCNQESRCKMQTDYVPTKTLIKSPAAAQALLKAITSTSIYKNANDFATCRDTYYIESFHNVILIYAPKRIHFSDEVYNMRVNLAILDWNENVSREIYSEQYYQSIKRPDRVAPYRVLKPKTYNFRDNIWSSFYAINW